MPVHNADIAAVFTQRRIAVGSHAEWIVIGELPRDIAAAPRCGEALLELPDIDPDFAGEWNEIAATHGCKLLDRLRRESSPAVAQIFEIPGFGARSSFCARCARPIFRCSRIPADGCWKA